MGRIWVGAAGMAAEGRVLRAPDSGSGGQLRAGGGASRVLIYSHDTFGLGHLRRCREIAHDLVDRDDEISVLILSGSPIIGSFDFRSRVDFVRVPGVIKLRNGEYTSLNLKIALEQTLAIRASIIRHTAEIFEPDLFMAVKAMRERTRSLDRVLTSKSARGSNRGQKTRAPRKKSQSSRAHRARTGRRPSKTA